MNELIRITPSERGPDVVSARELYAYFGVKTRFDIWVKRMFDHGFVAGQDYEVTIIFEPNLKGGKQNLTDYALTIDAAKEISMLQRSEKGKAARQFFIDAEKAFRQLIDGDSSQLLVQQAQRINLLERKVSRIVEAQQKAVLSLNQLPRSSEPLPLDTTRMKVRAIVSDYCRATGSTQQDTWRYVYERLYILYRIKIRAHKRSERESWLDVADRKGFMNQIYAIVSAELVKPSLH